MNTQRIELRENGKRLIATICLAAVCSAGFMAYRKYVPPTPQGYEVAAR